MSCHQGELHHLYLILITPWQSGKGSGGRHSANYLNTEHCWRVVEENAFLYIASVDSKDMQVSSMQKIELIQRYRLFLKNRIKSDFFI